MERVAKRARAADVMVVSRYLFGSPRWARECSLLFAVLKTYLSQYEETLSKSEAAV
jgi:hypothetical protein